MLYLGFNMHNQRGREREKKIQEKISANGQVNEKR